MQRGWSLNHLKFAEEMVHLKQGTSITISDCIFTESAQLRVTNSVPIIEFSMLIGVSRSQCRLPEETKAECERCFVCWYMRIL